MSINSYGLVIIVLIFFPKLLFKYIKNKKNKKINKLNHQVELINYIASVGVIFFSIFEVFDIKYNPTNDIIRNIWLGIFTVIVVLIFILYFRFLINGRDIKYKYDKIIVCSPIMVLEGVAIFFSSIILQNYIVVFFSSVLLITNTFLGYSYYKQARFM